MDQSNLTHISLILDEKSSNMSTGSLSIRSILYIEKLKEIILTAYREADLNDNNKKLTYIWADEAKQFSILLRDCTLNLLKFGYKKADNLRSSEQEVLYKKEISEVLLNASTELDSSFKDIINGGSPVDPQWTHETNPSEVILKHISTIEDQIKKIQRSEHKLDNISNAFREYRQSFHEAINQRQLNSEETIIIIRNLYETFKSSAVGISSVEVKRLISKIEDNLATIENRPVLRNYDAIILEETDKLTLPVENMGGNLQYKTIDILSEVSTWATFNLMSPLKQLDRQLFQYNEKVKITLFQVINRLKAKIDTASDEIVFVPNELNKLIKKLISDFDSNILPNILDRLTAIDKNIDQNILVSQVYNDTHNFLPISMLAQMKSGVSYKQVIEDRYNLTRLKEEFNRKTKGLFEQKKTKKEITSADYIEGLLRFNPDDDENALFMRIGFLGSSFTVKRPEKLEKISRHYNLWKSGFSGSLLISGASGSGKSTLLELFPLTHTDNHNYNIIPDHTLIVEGNKTKINYDLIKSIKFIIKNIGPSTCIISIDDLTKYAASQEKMYDLVSNLLPLIRKNNHKIYFVITMTRELENRLRIFFDFDNIFTEVIYTDNMSQNLISEALQMRAHAVSDHDGNSKDTDITNEKVNEIAQDSNGNIGMGMRLWGVDKKVRLSDSDRLFKNKIKAHSVILNNLLIYEKQYIPELIFFFDQVESQHLLSDIDHLIKQKIILRYKEGWIMINPLLRHHIRNALRSSSTK